MPRLSLPVVRERIRAYDWRMAVTEQISEAELQSRMLAVENAVAQQELEGLTVSPEVVADMYLAARGEMTSDEVIANIYARLKMNSSKSADGRTECSATECLHPSGQSHSAKRRDLLPFKQWQSLQWE